MFLAWKEIKHAKTRYALVIGILILVSYLVYFLTGLAYGLAEENRTAIDKWDADAIVLPDGANVNINRSVLKSSDKDQINADSIASLGVVSTVLQSPKKGESDTKEGEVVKDIADDKIEVAIFGINSKEFIMPNVIEGESFGKDFEAVADIRLHEEYGVEIGDELVLFGDLEESFKIVGFTEQAQFNVQPVLYTTIPTFQAIRFGKGADSKNESISAFILRHRRLEDIEVQNDELKVFSIDSFINELPGYMAQVLTFGLMIIFLITIAAVIIGIFMYVLTVQKISMFGVMKAQGISTFYIAKYVVNQTFLLSIIGLVIGLLLTLVTAYFLPSSVPFSLNVLFMSAISFLILLFSVLGSLFSVYSVAQIDPLEAIG